MARGMVKIISGTARGVEVKLPPSARPTLARVREGIFSAIQFDLDGARCLDLFAGSGALGIEALSRGAKSCDFVEKDRDAIKTLKENLEKVRFSEQSVIKHMDAADYVRRAFEPEEKFDIIFFDPPYGNERLMGLLPILPTMMNSGGIIMIESTEIVDGEYLGLHFEKYYRYGAVYVSKYSNI